MPELDAGWQDWIASNRARYCAPRGMFDILLAHGFEPGVAEAALDYAPPTPPPTSLPLARREPLEDLELYTLDDFLSEAECLRLIKVVRGRLRPSRTTNEKGPHSDYRTSRTCHLGQLGNPLAEEVDARICRALGDALGRGETIQAQWYEPGQEFKAHTDTFEPGHAGFDEAVGVGGQRSWTFMVYLTEGRGGGETEFVHLERRFVPRRGQAVIWNNLQPDWSPNPASLHWGRPVEQGNKVIITKWFRTQVP